MERKWSNEKGVEKQRVKRRESGKWEKRSGVKWREVGKKEVE